MGEGGVEETANSERDEPTLQQLILADLPAHHQPAASWRAAQPAIQDMVDRSQQWIVDDLVKALQQSKSPDDKDYPEDRFRQDIAKIVNADGTQGHNAWSKLQKVLLRRYEKELLPAVRRKIADQQARQYAPQLMNQNWTPTNGSLEHSTAPAAGDIERSPGLGQRPAAAKGKGPPRDVGSLDQSSPRSPGDRPAGARRPTADRRGVETGDCRADSPGFGTHARQVGERILAPHDRDVASRGRQSPEVSRIVLGDGRPHRPNRDGVAAIGREGAIRKQPAEPEMKKEPRPPARQTRTCRPNRPPISHRPPHPRSRTALMTVGETRGDPIPRINRKVREVPIGRVAQR